MNQKPARNWDDGIPRVYQYRRSCDDVLDIVMGTIIVLALVVGIFYFVPKSNPKFAPSEVKIPDLLLQK